MSAPVGFVLKKALATAVMPLSVCLLLLGLGVVYILARRPREALAPFTIGAFLLYAFSLNTVAGYMIRPLERVYPILDLASPNLSKTDVKWVVVLGAGHWTDRTLTPAAMLDEASLFRLVEGVRVAHRFPKSVLILSGGKYRDEQPNAQVMAAAVAGLGVDPTRILLESHSLDTQDEAELIKDMVGSDPFVLVTSAAHMLRAVKLFEHQGLKPIPAPAHFRAKGEPEYLLPHPGNIQACAEAAHEYLGLAWSCLLGRVSLDTP